MIDSERWLNVSDETVRYFLGHYGEFAAPPDPDVVDRVLSLPKVDALRDAQPVSLDGARARFGDRISDEELLLRLTMPAGAGRRDARRAADRRTAAAGAGQRPRPARPPPARGRAASLDLVPARPQGRRPGGVASCLLTTSAAFVFDIDGTLVHRAGAEEVHVDSRRA